MEDKLLIDGLFARDERSVARLEEKYSGYCYTVAYAVVRCRALALDELSECIPSAENTEQQADTVLLREAVNGFLDSLERERRIVFIQRYWYMLGISEIAAERGMTEGAVKMSLKRTRDCLKIFLEKEGFTV